MAIKLKGNFNLSKTTVIGGGKEPNAPPYDILLSTDSMLEKSTPGTVIATLSARDPNSWDTFTFSLTDDAEGRFVIMGNLLLAGLVGTDRQESEYHDISIRVTDEGGLSFEKTFRINVLERKEPPIEIILSSDTIPENSPQGTVIGTLSAIDPDPDETFTFVLLNSAGNRFQIVGNELQAGPIPTNFELASSHLIRVRVIDKDGLALDKDLVIRVIDVNEAPTDIIASNYFLDEGAPAGYAFAKLLVVDPDGRDSWTFELLNDFGGRFAIDDSYLVAGSTAIDPEDASEYLIPIRVTDSGGLSVVRTLQFQVNTAPVTITLTSNIVNENAGSTTVGWLAVIDKIIPGRTYTFELIDDANGVFAIIQGNRLVTTRSLDYEEQATHNITVRAWDGDLLYVDKVFTIIVRDMAEPPYEILLSDNILPENSPQGTFIGKLTALDQDSGNTGFTYQIISNSPYFQIVGDELQAGTLPANYEASQQLSVRITAFDNTGRQLARPQPNGTTVHYKDFVILVQDVNEPPTNIALTNSSLPERSEAGTVVGNLVVGDPDIGDTHEFFLLDDAGGKFQIVGNQLQAGSVPSDHIRDGELTVRVLVRDSGGLELEKELTITITRVWRAPTDIILEGNSIEENSPADVLIGRLTAIDDDIGDEHTFGIIGGSPGYFQRLKIVGNGLYTNNTPFDYEGDTVPFFVTIRAIDKGGKYLDKTFAINIVNENEAPTTITFSGSTLPERSPQGTLIATMTTTDPDQGDVHTYSLIDDFGGVFQINGNRLEAGPTPSDGYLNPSYNVTVRSTDSGGLYVERTLTVSIQRVFRPAEGLSLDNDSVPENSPANTLIGKFIVDDPDQGDSHTFALIGHTEGYVKIVGDKLYTAKELDHETLPSFEISVRVTDSRNNIATFPLTINVLDVNEPVTDLTLLPNTLKDLEPVGTIVGTLVPQDEDQNDEYTYELLDDYDGAFAIERNELKLVGQFRYSDYIARPTIMAVKVMDGGAHEFTKSFPLEWLPRVTLTPVPSVINEQGITIGTLSVDEPGSYTFFLDDDAGGQFQLNGAVIEVGPSLIQNPNEYVYIRVRAVDVLGRETGREFGIKIGEYAIYDPETVNQYTTFLGDRVFQSTISGIPGGHVRSNVAVTSGKWYFEITTTGVDGAAGLATADAVYSSYFNDPKIIAIDSYNGWVMNGSRIGTIANWRQGTAMVAFDADNGRVWFGGNGSWTSSHNPSTGVGGFAYNPGKPVFAYVYSYNWARMTANFGQEPFKYPVPSGFMPGFCGLAIIDRPAGQQ